MGPTLSTAVPEIKTLPFVQGILRRDTAAGNRLTLFLRMLSCERSVCARGTAESPVSAARLLLYTAEQKSFESRSTLHSFQPARAARQRGGKRGRRRRRNNERGGRQRGGGAEAGEWARRGGLCRRVRQRQQQQQQQQQQYFVLAFRGCKY